MNDWQVPPPNRDADDLATQRCDAQHSHLMPCHVTERRETWDVVVIGAGPAGATLSALLAAHGARVLLVERRDFPRLKVCGGCLNSRAQMLLQNQGLNVVGPLVPSVPLDRLQLLHADRRVAVPLAGVQAISRDDLDQALVDAAVARGAEFRPATLARVEVASCTAEWRSINLWDRHRQPSTIDARVVVIASGLSHRCLKDPQEIGEHVRPASRLGLATRVPGESWIEALADGMTTSRISAGTPGELTLAIGTQGYVGIVRLADGSVNVAAAVTPLALKAQRPDTWVNRTLRSAGLPPIRAAEALDWQGTRPFSRSALRPAAHRLLVVGDAAGYVEPFTGEGMAWAIESAIIAVPWVLRGIERWSSCVEYAWRRQLQQTLSRRQIACHVISELLSRPLAVRMSLATLAACPPLTRSLVRRFSSSVA